MAHGAGRRRGSALLYLDSLGAQVSLSGLVEWAAAFYLFAGLYALGLWRERLVAGDRGWGALILVGMLAGGAVSTKYPAVVFVVLPVAAAVWRLAGGHLGGAQLTDRRGTAAKASPQAAAHVLHAARYPRVKSAAVFFAAVALACGPWLAKNLLLADNPVYPLAYRWLDGRTRTAAQDAQWRRAHSPPNFSPLDLIERSAGIGADESLDQPLGRAAGGLGVSWLRAGRFLGSPGMR